MAEQNPNLVYKYEKRLFIASLITSVLLWIALTVFTLGIGLLYVLLIVLALLIAHGFMMAQVKGYGVRISPQQFPQLHKLASDSADRMGMTQLPDIYLLQLDGMLNAFATHFLSRNFVILTSEMLEACEDDPQRLSFVITHELTHLHRKHTRWMSFLMPARLIPFLGMAYSRACEYTCDAHAAYFGTQNADEAVKAVQVLATGSKRWADKIDPTAYQEQLIQERGVLTTVAEISSTHPFTAKRVAHIRRVVGGEDLPVAKFTKAGLLVSIMFNQQLLVWLFIAVFAGAAVNAMMTFKEAAQTAQNRLTAISDGTANLGLDGDLFDAMSLEADDYRDEPVHDDPVCDDLYSIYEKTVVDSAAEYKAFRAYHLECKNDNNYESYYVSYSGCEPLFEAYLAASPEFADQAVMEVFDCHEKEQTKNTAAMAACQALYDVYLDTEYGSPEEETTEAAYNQCREAFLMTYDA